MSVDLSSARRRADRAAFVVGAAIASAAVSQAQTSSTIASPPPGAASEIADGVPIRSLGVVTVTGGQPTSLPTQIPATMEGVTRDQIERTVNATDSEDALKYLPSLLVRKRYIGDYNHAILSSRASGTGNSARSAVYADGILLSNYLGNGVGGLSFPPRWGMVTPEEIERVDVMYGPFSAAYPGNSVGAVVVFTTRMPQAFEAHARVGYTSQPFELYGTNATFRAWETSVSLGSREGAFAWRLDTTHTDSHGQPLTFATRLVSAGTPGGSGTPVTGAVPGANPNGQSWVVIGSGTEYRTRQDQLKAKVAYDLTPMVRANYEVGVWRNRSDSDPASYLRDATGAPVFSGPVSIGGSGYSAASGAGARLGGADFPATRERLIHVMQGATLKSHTAQTWDWEVDASRYDYRRDDKRQNAASNAFPGAADGGAGTLAAGGGTGWSNLAGKGIWRPQGAEGPHTAEFGAQRDSHALRYLTSALAGNWLSDDGGGLAANVAGNTRLQSLWAQDAWRFAADWKTVLGLRAERWDAFGGTTSSSASTALAYPARHEQHWSPKAALAWQATTGLVLKASAGRALRMPTVGELYGSTSTANFQYVNDPNLRPEKSWTGELTAEQDVAGDRARLTFFAEDTRDSLYSQTVFDPVANANVTRVQNVGRIRTTGWEAAYSGTDVVVRGLDVGASATFANSIIRDNAGFVAVPGDTVGKRQPNIPKWRATMLASYRIDDRWSVSGAARYSGPQYRTLNNADVNGFTYTGVSRYFTTDARLRVQLTRQWSAAFGIDNANDDRYWNFHPYPQRSYSAELKFDL